MTWQDITSIVSIVGAAMAIYAVWRKVPHEARGFDASAAEAFEKAATSAAERATRLEARIEKLEKLTSDQEARIETLECENEDLRDWIERLVHQVQSLGAVPVQIRKRGKKEVRDAGN